MGNVDELGQAGTVLVSAFSALAALAAAYFGWRGKMEERRAAEIAQRLFPDQQRVTGGISPAVALAVGAAAFMLMKGE